MKPFHSWVESMANSIEDASIIVKDAHGNIILPPIPKDRIYDDIYEKWSERQDPPYYDADYFE